MKKLLLSLVFWPFLALAQPIPGGVHSVSSADGSLTIAPARGAVDASLSMAHTNLWTATQSFSNVNILSGLLSLRTGTSTLSALKFTGPQVAVLKTNPVTGTVEAVADKLYYTIVTAQARKEIALVESPVFVGDIAVYTTNGRLSSTTTVAVSQGGTGITSYTAGDVLIATGSTTLSKLAKGSANQVLGMNSGATTQEYKSVSSGTGVTVTHGANSIVPSVDQTFSPTWSGDHTFNGKLIVPNGSNPTLNSAGQIALDSTDSQFLAYINSAVQVVGVPKQSRTFVLDAPTGADVFPIIQFPYAITVTKVTGTVFAATSVTFQLDHRSSSTLGSAGTSILTSSLVATTTGANTTSFASASVAAYRFISLVASAVSGTPGKLVITIEYTIDRT